MILRVGAGIIKLKGIPTLYSSIKRLQFLSMVAFGTDTIAEIRIRLIMQTIGKKSVSAIFYTTNK